jgi:SAM-dependent methyltransferase
VPGSHRRIRGPRRRSVRQLVVGRGCARCLVPRTRRGHIQRLPGTSSRTVPRGSEERGRPGHLKVFAFGQDRGVFRHSAHVYDLLYEATGKDYKAEATTLHALIQERSPDARSLLDVACGTGGHLVHLRQWYEVVGLDIDPGMLAEAQRRLPDETFIEGDMRSFDVGRTFDAVVCLFSSIGYMPSEDDLARAVSTMISHLRPGGVFVMDGWIRPDAWADDEPIHVHHASDATVTVTRMSRSHRQGNASFLDMHHLIGSSEGIEHAVDVHEMTLFESRHYEESLRGAGLISIETLPSPSPGRDRYVGIAPPG